MKKIMIIALAVIGSYCSAEAQRPACKAPDGKVCTKKGCYKTPYAHNFAVCKSEYGYYVCCEEPNQYNSTFPAMPVAKQTQYRSAGNEYVQTTRTVTSANEINDDLVAPQSQSYPRYSANVSTSYEGYYGSNRKGKIRVCNNSDNVADANQAPYNGCPTPAYDGPEKNITRNVNVSNPSSAYPQPPNSGNKQ